MNPHQVALRGLPVRLWLRLQEHTDALFREFRLMPEPGAAPGLAETLGELGTIFPRSLVPELRGQVWAAAERGDEHADIAASVDEQQARLMLRMHELLCEVDEYCRKEVLLTLPLPDDAVALRRWVVDEIARQVLEGGPPGVWPAATSDEG